MKSFDFSKEIDNYTNQSNALNETLECSIETSNFSLFIYR